ncbi:hypothetical protein [Tannockella kyphosi]|uniref:hypothetical protein n=1 Tax=Tannockella kyphosi TaxID=2899121 RepID=UPI0020131DB4|nr:hypothetical protein [Tannockella kyphosi]
MEDKKKRIIALVFIGLAFVSCGMFPFVNLTKENPIRMEIIQWVIVVNSIAFYYYFGKLEAKVFSQKSIIFVASFNSTATFVGLGSRFLLEFGEVSNVYNFTLPNIVLQLCVSITLTCGTWFFYKRVAEKE